MAPRKSKRPRSSDVDIRGRSRPTSVTCQRKRDGEGRRNPTVVSYRGLGELLSLVKSYSESTPSEVVAHSNSGNALSSSKSSAQGRLPFHFSMLLHSVYLITQTGKAQFKALPVVPDGHSPVSTYAATTSTVITTRWLDALTLYMHTTVSLDDVARTAKVFPEWISIRWSKETSLVSDDLHPTHVLTGEPSGAVCVHSQIAKPLVGRASLLAQGVISVEAAKSALNKRLGTIGGEAAQKRWWATVLQWTSYAAYSEQIAAHEVRCAAESGGSGNGSLNGVNPIQPSTVSSDGCNADSIEDEEILSMLSPELRKSLSAEKLRGVVAQVRWEKNRVGTLETERIEQAQERERLLSTYEQVRSYFGEKRMYCNALKLLIELESGGRFDDRRGAQGELNGLLSLKGSGLSASTVTEAPYEVNGCSDPSASTGPTSFGVVVTDIATVPREKLGYILIHLDRSRASVQELITSIEHLSFERA